MTDFNSLCGDLSRLIKPAIEEAGFELVELKVARVSRGISVKILADRAEGGISIQECVRINKVASALLDASGLIGPAYLLEVSSPGLDRNLRTERDFRRCLNRPVKFYLAEKAEGRLEWEGTVVSVQNGKVEINSSGKILAIDLDNINKAVVII